MDFSAACPEVLDRRQMGGRHYCHCLEYRSDKVASKHKRKQERRTHRPAIHWDMHNDTSVERLEVLHGSLDRRVSQRVGNVSEQVLPFLERAVRIQVQDNLP